VYAWVSASRDGSRLGVSFGNDANILDGQGHRIGTKLPDSGGALPVVQISSNGRSVATIESVTELQYPPPVGGIIGPPIPTLVPFLFLTDVGSRERTTVARSTVTTGWLGPRLMRSEPAGEEPFEQQVCLLRRRQPGAGRRNERTDRHLHQRLRPAGPHAHQRTERHASVLVARREVDRLLTWEVDLDGARRRRRRAPCDQGNSAAVGSPPLRAGSGGQPPSYASAKKSASAWVDATNTTVPTVVVLSSPLWATSSA
jgi:hypothetical protein